ncbi:transcriptional activator FtrA [Listeria grayi]|uniref:Transcriptional activator FtrA n=1 Tax=Listeria grayi TaxID=1641 RepID=A0A378MM11_LISGR|nr:helix-turn-helix domain-containing protein [Listeria grayi]STY44755.1 transcriptional activator FtrA [Listeria grayi]
MELTELTNSNRVTLNRKFRERFGCTAMAYLLNYRLKVAADLLTHTGLTVNEIAASTGFGYETYFIKQFSAKKKFLQRLIGKKQDVWLQQLSYRKSFKI